VLPRSLDTEALPVGHKPPICGYAEPRICNRRTIRESKTGLRWRHRNLAVKQVGARELPACGDAEVLVRTAEPIAKCCHRATTHVRVPIHPSQLHAAAIRKRTRSAQTASPPGMKGFMWRQRNPTQAAPSTPSEKPYLGRAPVSRRGASTRPPAPAAAPHVPKPTAVVIRRPTPGCGVDPGPAIVVLPSPLTGAIGRPVGCHSAGRPRLSVLGRYPVAIRIQVSRAIHIGTHITIGLRRL
jgi:hypothetical protein